MAHSLQEVSAAQLRNAVHILLIASCKDLEWKVALREREGDFRAENAMHNLIFRFVRDERGATAIEYAIIAAGISIVILAAVQAIGTALNLTFTDVKGNLSSS